MPGAHPHQSMTPHGAGAGEPGLDDNLPDFCKPVARMIRVVARDDMWTILNPWFALTLLFLIVMVFVACTYQAKQKKEEEEEERQYASPAGMAGGNF